MDFDFIKKQAPILEVDNDKPFTVYLKSATNLLEAINKKKRGGFGVDAAILSMRFLHLVLHTIPQHKDYPRDKNSQYSAMVGALRARSSHVLLDMERYLDESKEESKKSPSPGRKAKHGPSKMSHPHQRMASESPPNLPSTHDPEEQRRRTQSASSLEQLQITPTSPALSTLNSQVVMSPLR